MTIRKIKPMEAAKGFKFGCDPELFVLNEKDEPVSAAGLIPGTKEEPHKVNYGAVQVDGMAAEFNIDPVENFRDFNRNIDAVLKQLAAMLPKGYRLSAVPSIRFAPEIFDKAPDEAKMLGCDPDFNAWTGDVNPPPSDATDPYLRTASGHLHFGWTEDADLGDAQHILNCRDFVKQLDWYLGAWSLQKDPDPTRRKLYGKAGAYRPKSYGVEYRVLSNFWIMDRESRLEVWNRANQAIFDMRKRFMPEKPHSDLVVQMINESTRNPSMEAAYRYPLMSIGLYS